MTNRAMSDQMTSMVRYLRQEVQGCVAAGIVDMATGMLLSFETTESHPSEVLDLLAGATLDLFQGRTVTMIENVFKERRGIASSEHYFQEILVNSSNLTHLFIRNNHHEDVVGVVVCPKSVNIGMLFASARRATPRRAAAPCPARPRAEPGGTPAARSGAESVARQHRAPVDGERVRGDVAVDVLHRKRVQRGVQEVHGRSPGEYRATPQ